MAVPGERLRLEFGILGPLRVNVDGEERRLAGDKLRGLLALLLLDAGRPVTVERLIDALWGEEPPATARDSLHVHVGRLRRALAADGSAGTLLATTPRGYVLRVEADTLDAARFRSLVAAAREARRVGEADAAADRYGQALALWRGEAFEDVALSAVEAARAELDALRLAALEERIDVLLELGQAPELVGELEDLVARHPLRERLRAQLMVALYAAGRQTDALATCADARRQLDELGLVPGPMLRELERAILRQDEELLVALPPIAAAGSPSSRTRRHRWWIGAAAAGVAALAVAGAGYVLRDSPPSAAPPGSPRVAPDSLVEIDPATRRVVSVTHVGKDPETIAFTRGAAWVTTADRTVARVDMKTREVRPIGGFPVAMAATATLGGDVWVSSFEEPFVTLVALGDRVVGDTGVVASGAPRVRLPGSTEALAVGGGYLWVTSPSDSGGRDTVFRVDLRTRRLVSAAPVGHLPLFVAFGYGSAWVSNYRGDSVSVIRPGSEQAETVAVGRGPLGIAAGGGGVWVVTFWDEQLVRIDPETRRVVARVRIGDDPLAVAVGGGGVWVTNRGSRTISRVDPMANRVVATIRLASPPVGIAFARGRLWVTTHRCGSPIARCSR